MKSINYEYRTKLDDAYHGNYYQLMSTNIVMEYLFTRTQNQLLSMISTESSIEDPYIAFWPSEIEYNWGRSMIREYKYNLLRNEIDFDWKNTLSPIEIVCRLGRSNLDSNDANYPQ